MFAKRPVSFPGLSCLVGIAILPTVSAHSTCCDLSLQLKTVTKCPLTGGRGAFLAVNESMSLLQCHAAADSLQKQPSLPPPRGACPPIAFLALALNSPQSSSPVQATPVPRFQAPTNVQFHLVALLTENFNQTPIHFPPTDRHARGDLLSCAHSHIPFSWLALPAGLMHLHSTDSSRSTHRVVIADACRYV